MLIGEEQLSEWTGYRRRADIVKFLQDHRVDFWLTRSGSVCTTLAAIEGRLVEKTDDFEFSLDGTGSDAA